MSMGGLMTVNCKEIYNNNNSITVGEMVEGYIVPAVRGCFGGVGEYVIASDNYPCIVLPWNDGKISDDYNVVIRVGKTATTLVTSSGVAYFQVGLMNMISKTTIYVNFATAGWSNNSSNGGPTTGLYLQSGIFAINVMKITDNMYQFGIWGPAYESVDLMAMNIIVTSMKKVIDDTPINSLVVCPFGTNSRSLNVLYKYNNSIISEGFNGWQLPTQGTSANMYQFNNGIMYHDNLYVCFPSYQTILKSLIPCDYSKGTPYDMWSDFVNIGGKNFTLHINAGNGTSGDSYITLARMKE